MVQLVNTLQEWEALMADVNAVYAVDFYADWCGPCKLMAPEFVKLSEVTPTIKFIKIDCDANEDVATLAGISAMPTFQIWKAGAKADEMIGASKEKLKALVGKYA
ncbi:hypothetical protein FOA52_016323 [Chlamydomonas sp. UWO 241]|nr:hypothetical protein FOA52_016323 [Chlamydomonas sp. UWO 241]